MKKNFFLTLMLAFVALFSIETATAQAPVATAEEAITGLLNRIGGNGAADKFEIVIDASLAENGKDVFVITAQNGKPCIKGNTLLSVATGINWYLNHYAHINLTWNNLTTDLSQVTLPVPASEDKHVSSAAYRYDFNTCTFSYSMAFWTWERWQQEIDWMALHGINAPLNLVGLDVVTRNFLKELGMSDTDIAAYVAGPGFIAWFAMNNLEGWGGTINSASTGVEMNGNPEWWYTRQEQLCRDMLQRMRELGMQPVIPGFSGQIPNSLSNYTITGFSSGDVINGGTWAGGYTRPDILHPNSSSYATLAPIYYKHLEAIMGVSEFYSMDPFHEGGLPSAVTNATCYPPIMAALDTYHNAVEDATKTSYNVSTEDNQAKWIIQYWQNIPQSGAFSAMSSYGDRFIGLDLFSDNIYAGNAAKWRDTGNACYYQGRPYIYCMLHNFGGRSGLHGRLETTMDGYFQALANNNNCQGIGATPEGTETNPILYDMLFELPWMDVNYRPTADEWLEDYAYSRYGVSAKDAPNALAALQNLKESVWNCEVNQQGTSEAVILARPNWTINNVSSWSTAAIYWDTQDVRLAADQLISVADLVTANGGKSGIANYNYDAIDVIRQAMVDYAAELLPLINAARGNDAEYTRLYQLYLQLMLDLDEMLSYDENFKLERWTSLARNIADEVAGTTENDRNWLEWNARTQVTVWSKGNTDLHDYSNRCWAGLIKDFHYWRWKYFFENNGNAPSGGWFSGFEYPWTVDFNDVYSYAGDYSQIVIPTDMSATNKAAQTFGKYFGRVKGATKNYIFPMGVETNGTKSDVIPEVYRGKEVELPLIIGKEVTISSVWIDLNNDGNAGNGETLTANGNNVTIPADAAIGKTKATVVFSDGTNISFNIALIEDITDARTVTAVAGANGTVAIEGADGTSITTTEAVKMTATANTGYNFENWTDAQGNVVSNDNPFIYYGKEEATFTANFIQDKWGVVADNNYTSELGTINQYKSYVHNMTFAYYNREAETIYEATAAPASVFTTIPQIINVPQGASFDVYYDDGDGTGLQYCYFRAYIDLNADGDFDDEGELLKEVGTQGAENTAVCSNKINVLLPYDAPLGITHMRLRFDGAYSNSKKPADLGAKDGSNRPVYEIILNVTEKSDKAATINVETNSADWGTVEVWTDETPDGSTGTEWVVSANIPMYLRATKASEDVEFLGWYDQYGRLLTTELEYSMLAREDATYTARFRKFLEIDGWQIEYRTEPGKDVVILTNVRKSGNHDLVIPETVEILGQQCKIVGFDNNLFKDNKDLWTISLPSTIEEMSNNRVFKAAIPGKGADQSANAANYITTDLGTTLAAGEDWSISLTIEDNGNNFNQWGSALIATGNAPMNRTYANGFQLYMQAGGALVVKTDVDGDGNKLTNLAKGTKYRIDIVYTHSNTKLVVTATPLGAASAAAARTGVARAASASLEVTQDMSDFTVVSHAIPEGVNITNLEVRKGPEPDPFEGCTNLLGIEVADGCESYYVDEETRTLYTTGGTDLHTLADEEKEEEIRALGGLIDLTEALIEEVALSVDPTGKATEVALTTTQGNDYYIWCNAPQSGDEGNVGNLLDGQGGTFFHSNWGNTTAPADGLDHHLTVELGSAHIEDFKFYYKARSGSGLGDYPKTIKVQGSNDGVNYNDIAIVEPRNGNGGVIENGAEWTSDILGDGNSYTYLRFMVTATTTNKSKDGHIYWHMAEFDLLKLTSSAEVASKYKNLAGVTNEETATVYDSMAEALYFYNNGGTADELQAAYDALKPLYDALNAKKDKILNGVYNINFGGEPLFIAYAKANELEGLTGAGNAGFRLFDATTTNTDSKHSTIQNNAIAAQAPADALFTIVPKDDYSGYHLSAQGNYMRATGVHSQWDIQAFDTDVANAGVYLFEETATADVFKLKSTINVHQGDANTNYVNDWGPVFGCDDYNKENLSTFTLTPVTEYTLSVPASGATTLCLPFNVVLPVGVTAYDLPKANVVKGDGYSTYELVEVAVAGETLAKNTPVIIKAAANDYTLTITMNDEGANGSVENSVLRSGLVKTTVAAGNNYTFDGKNFNIVAADTEIAANQCWMELDEPFDTTVIDKSEEPEFYGVYTLQAKSYNDDIHHELDVPIFVAADGGEYKLFAKGENTEALVGADTYFTITPDDNGYTLQAQGLYVKTPQNLSGWEHILCTANGEEAGTYLLEDAGEGLYSLESAVGGSTKYLNVWYNGNSNYYIGNDNKYSKIAITKETEYTLTVPEGGVTTLWLPFNVVLPEGVTAYDVVENSFETQNGLYKYTLTELAVAGKTLAKNTPVVIEAEPGSYTLKITMNNEGAIASASGSALCGNYWERNLAAGENNYQPAVTAEGLVFNRVDAATTVAANSAWLKLTENKGAVIYKEFPEGPDAPTALTDGAVYRIKGRTEDGAAYRTVYTNGAGNKLCWTSDAKNDATTLFVAQETTDGVFKLVSALGNGLWNNERVLDEDGVELTLLPGTVDGTFAIRGNGERIFSAHGGGTSGEMNMYSDGRKVVGENETTDFVFEEVTDADELAKVAFNKIIRKGNHYATLFLPYNVTVPENVKAYTATIENKDQEKQGVISLVEIADGIIPARTAVILRREDNTAIGEFSFKYTTDASSYDYEGNLFGGRVTTGYVGSDNVNERYYLLLNTDTKGEALYKVYREYNSGGGYVGENNGGYIKCEANKAYMKLDVANGASSSYSFRVEGTTGIEEVEGESAEVKAIYDLQGRKLTEITKPGFYIVDGEKVLVK